MSVATASVGLVGAQTAVATPPLLASTDAVDTDSPSNVATSISTAEPRRTCGAAVYRSGRWRASPATIIMGQPPWTACQDLRSASGGRKWSRSGTAGASSTS